MSTSATLKRPGNEPDSAGPATGIRRRRAWLGRVLLAALVAGVCLLVALALVMTTSWGGEWIVRSAERWSPIKIDVERISGTLMSTLKLDNVHIEAELLELRIKTLQISLQPMALLMDQLRAGRVLASTVTLRWRGSVRPVPEAPVLPPAPIALAVEQLQIDDFTFQTPHGASVHLDRLEGRVVWDHSDLSMASLRVDAGPARIEGRGLGLTVADQSIRGELRAEWTAGAWPTVQSAVALRGSLDALRVSLEVAEPWSIAGEGTWSTVVNRGTFTARYGLDLSRLREGWPVLRIAGGMDARIAGEDTSVRIDWSSEAGSPWLTDWRGRAELRAMAESIELHEATFEMPFLRDGRASGTIGTRSGWPIEVDAVWASAAVPAAIGLPDEWLHIRLGAGRMSLSGPVSDGRMAISAESAVERGADRGVLSANGSVTGEAFRVDSFRLAVGEGGLTGSGRLAWSTPVPGADLRSSTRTHPEGELSENPVSTRTHPVKTAPDPRPFLGTHLVLEASADRFDPVLFFPDWPGRLDGTITLEAGLGPTTSFSVDAGPGPLAPASVQADLHGTLRDQPFRLQGHGLADANGFDLRLAEGQWGPARAVGRLSRFSAWDADFAVRAIPVSDWLPGWKGDADATVRITGSSASPNFDLSGRIDNLSGPGVHPASLTAELSGSPAAHRAALRWSSSALSARVTLQGDLESWGSKAADRRYRFSLHDFDITSGGQALSLASPARGEWAEEYLELEPVCLQGNVDEGAAKICASAASRRPPGVRAAWHLDAQDVPVSAVLFGRRAGVGTSAATTLVDALQGRFDAELHLRWLQDGSWRAGAARLETTAIRIPAPAEAAVDEAGEPPGWVIPPLRARLIPGQSDYYDFTLVSSGEGAPSIDATARIRVQVPDWRDSTIDGSANLELGQLAGFGDLLPELRLHGGRVSGRAGVSGTLGAPRPRGYLELHDGDVEVPEAGLRLKSVEGTLRLAPDGTGGSPGAQISLRARSGKGHLALQGHIQSRTPADHGSSDDRTGFDGSLHLTGDDARVFDSDAVQLVVSPDLRLSLASGRLALEGDVQVQRARVLIREQPQTAVRVSADERFVAANSGDSGDNSLRRRLDALDVRLRLGDDARFTGYGLDTPLTGSLRLRQNEGRATANGSIRAKAGGRYSVWGQTLDIRDGRLFWSDTALTQPALDVEATRSPVPDVTVGLIARGPLARPRIELFSTPAMAQSDQLSWLLFGRPMQSATTAGQTSLLNQAAATLGIGAGNLLARRFGDRLPVNVAIEVPAGQTQESAALVLGRYLTPDLYVSYGISILERLSTLRIEYALSPAFRVVTETSGDHNAADVYVTVERP